jgi:hypothetical protein
MASNVIEAAYVAEEREVNVQIVFFENGMRVTTGRLVRMAR